MPCFHQLPPSVSLCNPLIRHHLSPPLTTPSALLSSGLQSQIFGLFAASTRRRKGYQIWGSGSKPSSDRPCLPLPIRPIAGQLAGRRFSFVFPSFTLFQTTLCFLGLALCFSFYRPPCSGSNRTFDGSKRTSLFWSGPYFCSIALTVCYLDLPFSGPLQSRGCFDLQPPASPAAPPSSRSNHAIRFHSYEVSASSSPHTLVLLRIVHWLTPPP